MQKSIGATEDLFSILDTKTEAIEESPSDKMILKPLDGFGGSGVILIEKSAMGNINSLLDFYIHKKDGTSDYVILQEYIEGADQGDVRILILNGVPIGAMRRIPGDKDHRSNVSAGGTVAKHKLTKQEKLLCEKIGPRLVQDGLYFVGAGTHPGAGVPGVLSSAKVLDKII